MPNMRASSRQLRALACTAVLAAAAVAGVSAGGRVAAQDAATSADRAARAKAATRPARSKPVAIRDRAAARRVRQSRWEPRPRNRKANTHRASKRAIRHFRRWSTLPWRYRKRVTGNYRGTTDEIIQWASYKWGFSPNVLRAVATIESWWRQRAIGDHGRSYGLFQIKRGHHCCYPTTRRSTAFNADYYAAWLRWVYDGRARWLNRARRGERYRRGDLWGAVGAWYSGRWHHNTGHYIWRVKNIIRKHVWRRSGFRYGG
jgi:hypothetical protein